VKFYGDLNLNDNQAQQMALQVEADFPLTPVVGRITFKGKRVWICIQVGVNPIWVPLGPKHDTFVLTQSTPSTSWTIQHNFNTTTAITTTPIYPLVQIFDDTNNQIIPDAIYYVDDSSIMVTFNTAASGTAVCMYGDDNLYGGLITPQYAYEYTQSTPSATWVVRHWLGYVPIVRVFDGTGEEIQPYSIKVDDAFQVTITFTSAITGVAKLV
jgi:hypothetical protein